MSEKNIGRGDTKPIINSNDINLKDVIDEIDNSKPLIVEENRIKRVREKPTATAYLITDEMIDEEAERISNLNFLALAQYKRELKKQIDDMDTTKYMIEMLEKIEAGTEGGSKELNFGQSIALNNIMNDIDLASREEMQEFKDNYDHNMEMLNKTMQLVEEREKEVKNIKMTSSYMNQCMLEVLDDKTKVLYKQSGKHLKKLKHYYKNIREIYEHRDSMDFIRDQVNSNIHYVQRVVNDLKKEKKNGGDGKNLTKSLQQNVTNAFCKVFKIEQMISFEKYLKDLLNNTDLDTERTSFLFNYLLYIIYINEKKKYKGYHKWVEALIMNVLDLLSRNYDLAKGKHDFDNELLDIMRNMNSLLIL